METINFSKISIAILAASLAGCGGSGGGGGDGESSSGTSIPDSFDLLDQSGTWRLTADSTFISDSEFVFGANTINLLASAEVRQVVVNSFQTNGNQVIFQSCDADAAETQSLDEAEDDIDLDDLTTNPACADEEVVFTKISDTAYRVAYNCPGVVSFTLDFVKLSDATEFDLGSLAFNSNLHADLNTSDGVCGTVTDAHSTSIYTPQPNGLNLEDEDTRMTTLTVAAPHDGNRIALDFEFLNDVQVTTYNVVDIADAGDEVAIALSSVIYGGTPSDPAFDFGESGTVTITAVSEFAASGNFNFTTRGGDTMNGSFSFDIQ